MLGAEVRSLTSLLVLGLHFVTMGHHDDDDDCELELAHRQVLALERLADETAAIQDTLHIIANHMLGGMTAEQVQEAVAEARALKQDLQTKRLKLAAAISAAQPHPKETNG